MRCRYFCGIATEYTRTSDSLSICEEKTIRLAFAHGFEDICPRLRGHLPTAFGQIVNANAVTANYCILIFFSLPKYSLVKNFDIKELFPTFAKVKP